MKNDKLNFLLALLIYSPTLIVLPQSIVYLVISAIGGIFLLLDIKDKRLYKQDVILFAFVLLTTLVYFLAAPISNVASRSANDFIPYTIFLLTTIFFSRHLNDRVMYFILYIICFEILIGIIEYYVLKKAYIIKPSVTGETEFGESQLLYYNRVYGLSQAVSILAYKVFIGVILVSYLKIKKFKIFIISLLLIGLYITFNRTAIIGSIIFLILFGVSRLQKVKLSYKVILTISLIILVYYVGANLDAIMNQFFRGREGDLSGRDMIFPYFFEFINNNLLLGNNVHKMWGKVGSSVYHAHNSYLQTLANLGIMFFIVLWIYILSFMKKSNVIFLFPILVYSSFQYGILWGVSFMDIIFFYLLFNIQNKIINSKNENTTTSSIFPGRR
ncbi:O-antigen ligase family protein [Chryseobacterium tongliaoense]|uniref:O-antigen ligase family protein n=1 Tax=Chryseobacterium tongliaoense TaxID=3240933 RepID=UPI003516196B